MQILLNCVIQSSAFFELFIRHDYCIVLSSVGFCNKLLIFVARTARQYLQIWQRIYVEKYTLGLLMIKKFNFLIETF